MTDQTEQDITDFVTGLPVPENFTPEDRYRMFRRVFVDSEEGRVVLREIISWGHLYRCAPLGSPVDLGLLAILEGERRMAVKLLDTIHREPPQRPTKQTR